MEFDWDQYLNLAHVLGDPESPQRKRYKIGLWVTLRVSIHSAYYASFHRARQYLERVKVDVPHHGQAHTFVSKMLVNSSIPSEREAGLDLLRLRFLRNLADYAEIVYDLAEKAEEALLLAENIKNTLF